MMNIKFNHKFIQLGIILIFLIGTGPLHHGNPQGHQITPNIINNPSIAVIYAVGVKEDKGYNNAVFTGIQKAQIIFSGMNLTEYVPLTQGDADIEISNLAAGGTHDLIIAIGLGHKTAVESAAITYSSQKFLLIDASTSQSNIAGVTFKHEEGSFLAGMMAAMTSIIGRIGFIGGLDISLINEFRHGYYQGALYINPNIVIDVAYVGSFGDPDTAKNLTDTMVAGGADVIFAAAGSSGLGVINQTFEYVANGTLVYSIGVDSNQDDLAPGVVLTSMMKRMDIIFIDQIGKIVNGNWLGGNSHLGLASNAVGLTNMNFTRAEKNTEFGDTKTRWDVIQETISLIINGNIVVNPSSTFPPTTTTDPEIDPPITVIETEEIIVGTSTTVTTTTKVETVLTETTKVETVFTETTTITNSKSEASFLPAFGGIIFFLMFGLVWIRRRIK